MDTTDFVIFLIAVFLGSYVQGITGFALGIVVMAIMAVATTIPVAPLAAAISLLALFNVLVALPGQHRDIDWRLFLGLTIGQIPGILIGLWLLDFLSSSSVEILELILGIFIVAGSLTLALRSRMQAERSRGFTASIAGFFGGLAGGMFAASGPVTGWYAYRQPMSVSVIRSSLLAGLLVTTLCRTTLVAFDGQITTEILFLVGLAVPVVALGTMLARRYRRVLSESQTRRFAFGFLCVVGCWIIGAQTVKLVSG